MRIDNIESDYDFVSFEICHPIVISFICWDVNEYQVKVLMFA